MFVQVMQGTTSDRTGMKRQFERWETDCRPGATGFLGSTAGVTDDGTVFIAARFESEQAARANSDRPEQSSWWSEFEKYFDGPVAFLESNDVDVQREPSSDAGFVQVIQSTVTNRARIEQINVEIMPVLMESRPEVVGSVSIWSGDRVCDVVYFTSEDDARRGEESGLADAHRALFDEWQSLMSEPSFLDLKEPWLS